MSIDYREELSDCGHFPLLAPGINAKMPLDLWNERHSIIVAVDL
jgi:hypothetical protein